MTFSNERFHHEDEVLAAYEEAEAAVWRATIQIAGSLELKRHPGENYADTVRRVARAIADAVIRSTPEMDDIASVPGVKVETITRPKQKR
jgi:hypothetical protein